MKRIILVTLTLLLTIGTVRAQESPEEIAQKRGVTFPIAELGSCANYLACRTHCEDPVNYNSCIGFAKKKGFYKEKEYQPDNNTLQRARQVLGCTSLEVCRNFCEKEENFDKCHSFAQRVGVIGGYKEDPRSSEFLAKAKEALGCTSYETCRNFCDNPANRDKCAESAQKIGVSGGYEYKGPGGCTSEETCRTFCSEPAHIEICQQFSSAHGSEFAGPGGCTDETSCRTYCEKNPSSCPGLGQTDYQPSQYCSKTPGCTWTNDTCQCTGTTNYGGDPVAECQKHNCSWTGSYCQCASTENYQEKWASECAKNPGCSWTNNTCQCSGSGPQTGESSQPYTPPTPYPSSPPSSGGTYNYDPATECAKQNGCSWTNNTCQCSPSTSGSGSQTPSTNTQPPPDPATECSQYPGCSWNGSSCQCQAVQGATTSNNLIRRILNLLGL